MPVPIKAVLFDFGNVIAYFDHTRAVRRFARLSDLPGPEIYAALYDNDLENDFEAGRLTAAEYIARGRATIGYRGGDEEFTSAFVDIFTPVQVVCELIPRLKPRYRLVLASNTNPLHHGHYREQFHDVLRHFDASGVSYEAGVRKPDSGFYAHCLRLAGCSPSECVFIDDMEVNTEGAKRFGMKALQYTSGPALLDGLRGLGIEV